MNSEKRTYQKKWFKRLLVTLSILVIIGVSLRFVVKSDWIFDKITAFVTEQANNQLNGELSIESIRGDLLNGFTIRNVHLQDERSETVAQIDSIRVSYGVRSLMRSPHTVDELLVYGGLISVEQLPDSSWNVLNILPEMEADEAEAEAIEWALEKAQLHNIDIRIQSEYLLPDEFLHIDNLQLDLTAGARDTGFYGSVRELTFQLREERLPEPIDFYLAARGEENRITLESLIVNTGRTLLEASAEYEMDGELVQKTELSPLSREDLAQYLDDLPLQQDLNITFSAGGRLDDLSLSLQASATGLQNLQVGVRLDVEDLLTIKQAELKVDGLDLSDLTGLDMAAVLESFSISGEGNFPIEHPEQAEWSGIMALSGLKYDQYGIDSVEFGYGFTSGNFDLEGDIRYRDEMILLAASIENLLGEEPGWYAEIRSDNTNIATWLHDEALDSELNIRTKISGVGFDPESFSADLNVEVEGTRFGEQPFSNLKFSGIVNPSEINGDLFAQLDRSMAEAKISASEWMEDPAYNFSLVLREFNVAEITGLEELPTYINGSLIGEGRSAEIETLWLLATASLDSSIVNGEEVDAFEADILIQDQFITIDNGVLESPIADAGFSIYQHITEFTNSSNRLDFDLTIKNISSFAPLLGFENLDVQGGIQGRLARNDSDILEFNGDADLENILVDTLFTADRITAKVQAFIMDEPEIDAALHIFKPVVMETGVQDVQFQTYATIRENETSGDVSVYLSNDNGSSITQSGSFRVDSLQTMLRTSTLEFRTQQRNLRLENPFDVTYSEEILRVDTLTIRTDDDESYLTLWVPHVDSLRQHAGLDAGNLNLGELQQTIMEQSFFEGFLSGTIEVMNSPDVLEVNATGLLRDFVFEEGRMDSLRFDASIADEWLLAEAGGWYENSELFSGNLQIPFIPGDPLTFDEQFFEQEISGSFNLNETDLLYWLSFMPDGAPEQTEGNISVAANLSGIAGNPELTGKLTINRGLFSGIRVDTVGVDISYLHEDEVIGFTGKVVKDRVQILDFNAKLPLLVDLKQAEVLLPSDDDSVEVNLRTNDFDLALFNSYVDPDLVRQISGRLEGDLSLTGIISNLEPRGRLDLTRGSMRVIPAGLTLSEIASSIRFEPDRIELQQFTMRSGPGRLRATGNIGIENLVPSSININMTANQFRAVNTPEYNALLNATANLTGSAESPVLRGDITFLNGLVNLQNFGDRAVEDVVLEDEEEPEPFEFYDLLAMEMNVNFGRNFIIRSRQYLDMEFALGGDVDLVKEKGEELQMFGTLEGLRGFVRPLGKNFELDEAIIGFFGPIDDPQLNITTRYSPPQAAGVNIFYIIDGTLQDPDFRFDSEPQLELQDIVSYTLFGKPFYELESWEQVVAGSGGSPTAADFALEVLLDRVEMLASQRLGIDVVQIDNTRSGSNNTTSIKTGWYLNEKTFFAILNEVGSSRPKTLFMLEYLLRQNLELIITQGDDSREGVDLRWRLDY
ncbi:MAG: translocation/assembly module TamB domain-containing protein [Balneolaceae bacterium]|nr:translocation/assembly module TamB domain-containing protein [Balneolaceae bacterium]